MKGKNKWIYVIPSLLVLLIGRYLRTKYGQDAHDKFGLIIAGLVILIFTVSIVYLVAKKYYMLSIGIVAVFIPLGIAIIGTYTGNIRLNYIGGLLTLIVMLGLYIYLKMYSKNK